MKQLRCRDLQPGDLLLKSSDGSMVSRAISFGQSAVGQQNTSIVHAGVLFDPTFIIEAQGSGLSANDLRVQDKRYGYIVFRPNQKNLAQGAGTCAKMLFDIHKTHGTIKYTIAGAVGSLLGGGGGPKSGSAMDKLLDDILKGKGHPFFCSQFVVYVYQFVAEQNGIPASSIFSMRDAKVSPSTLASALQSSGSFQEAGYLLPNER